MSNIAIDIKNLGKKYKLFKGIEDRVLEVFGLNRILFWRERRYTEFWALRGINLTVKRGERLGIIGRNGAGKSTLLKIIAGNVFPTEGRIIINGGVQCLMELGTGFHPEFTGLQNIRTSLAYQGFDAKNISELETEIVEFAELEDFIEQPVKTYSAGMYARLAFSAATATKPDILIIDEILGVGDAYFLSKCSERMKNLTISGTTLLFVSHSMSQILQICDKAIWVDRGKIATAGRTLDVVKAYERYNRVLENRRLMARNLKAKTSEYKSDEMEKYSDFFLIRFVLKDYIGIPLDVRCIRLWRNGEPLDELRVGSPQDTSHIGHSSYIPMTSSEAWSDPKCEEGVYFRSIVASEAEKEVFGTARFDLYVFESEVKYELEIEYRYQGNGRALLEVYEGDRYYPASDLPSCNRSWATKRCPISTNLGTREAMGSALKISSWPGTGELCIRKVSILSRESKESALFKIGDPMTINVSFESRYSGIFPVTFCIVIYRNDGIKISCHLSEEQKFQITAGEIREASLMFASIILGDGNYFISVALYSSLERDGVGLSKYYDLIDRSHEFKVVGNDPIDGSVFHHPVNWSL